MTERTLRRISPKRIILAGSVIAIALALVIGATGAFFSDEETSLGNVFTAGAIDLKIDNESYAIDHNIPGYDNPVGDFVASKHTSWELRDLTIEKFFDFIDLKPGDYGEDTISVHVDNNDAWLCAAAQITEDSDVTYTEPELDDDQTVNEGNPVGTDGELDDELNFIFWLDDGDNVYETCGDQTSECFNENVFLQGSLADMDDAGQITLADAGGSIFDDNGPVPGDTTFYIGKAWCFGNLTGAPVSQDNLNTEGPLDRGDAQNPVTGIECDGAEVDNAAQTDRVVGDIQFYAEQSRNNPDFSCSEWVPDFPDAPQQPEEEVGADLAAYVTPSCTTTISSDIQVAVNNASDNDTICVDDGAYNETVVIDRPLTLASVNGPTNTATITGGVQIDSSDVTVTGFIINPGDVPADPGDIGVFLNGSLSNIEISYNDIDGPGAGTTRGILTTTSATYTNVNIMNNIIHDHTTGIYLNPASGLVTIQYNDIDNNTAGIGGLNGVNVTNNEFEHTSAAQEAIGVDTSNDSNPATVNFNNFLDDTRVNTYGDLAADVDAEDNFWSPNGGAAQTGGGDEVDFTPEAGGAYPHQ